MTTNLLGAIRTLMARACAEARIIPRLRLPIAAIAVALLTFLVVLGPGEVKAASTIDNVAIDTDPTGNTATSVGSFQPCARINDNGILDADEDEIDKVYVDVVIGPSGVVGDRSLAGFEYEVLYNQAMVRVTARNHDFLLGAAGSPNYLNLSDAVPDTDGTYYVGVVDLGSNHEQGPGVTIRLTLEGIGTGESTLVLDGGFPINFVDEFGETMAITTVINGSVAVNQACGTGNNYVVDTTSDANLTSCTGAASDCSLRGAINDAAGNAGADTITFDSGVFPAASPATITLTASLPALSNTGDTIDASGAGVEIAGATYDPCFEITGSNNTIVGVKSITGCGTAIQITGADNTIGGTNAAESACGADTSDDDGDGFVNDGCAKVGTNSESGADCQNTTDDDLVDSDGAINDGCPSRGQGTVISGNLSHGVAISGSSATGNTVAGNYIGVDAAGTTSAPNIGDGVRIEAGANDNTVGGTTAGHRNVISGHGGVSSYGVHLTGVDVTANVVAGNYIGTDAAGTSAIANSAGVGVDNGASSNTIGGTVAGSGNLISGNDSAGIQIGYGSGNTVAGNFLGTNADGSSAIPNSVGVLVAPPSHLQPATGNIIGGSTSAARNVISGNSGQQGIAISGLGAQGNTVSGNYIGLNASGTAALANAGWGISISSSASGNMVGGSTAGQRNIISGNGDDGVFIGSGSGGNSVKGNFIGTNASGSAAVANTGNGVLINSQSTSIGGPIGTTPGGSCTGECNVIAGNTAEQVLVFAVDGIQIRGNFIGTDVTGSVGLNASDGVRIQGNADATSIGGINTGEGNLISGNGIGIHINTSTGTNANIRGNKIGTNSAGTGSLPNSSDGIRIVSSSGNLVGGSTASHRNVISGNGQDGVVISGTSAGSNTVAGNYIGTNASGAAALGNASDGVRIESGSNGNTIGGSTAGARNVISGNGSAGVEINGAASTGNVVKGNFIGTDAAGTADISSQSAGVRTVSVVAAIGGTVGVTPGGSCTGECNLISGNTTGVYADGAGVNLKGNYIGTSVTGNAALGNSAAGVTVQSTFSGGTIGGSTAAEANIISSNGRGIDLMSASATTVHGNYVGTNSSGANLGNSGIGVEADSFSTGNIIGGVSAGQGNVIAFNTSDGVTVQDGTATGNSIRGNSIHSNGGLGIDLNPDGVTANDAGDGDAGANNLMNYPVISAASYNGATQTLTVSGTLDTASPDTAAVDVFSTDVVDGSGYGEGREYLGSATPNGSGAWTLNRVGPLPLYGSISATATKPGDGTSEFSLTLDPDIDGDGFASSVDNCDVDYNPLQIDHDGDGIGDVCDTAVRNRYSASSSSVVTEYTTGPGENIPADTRAYHSWDYEAGSSIDVGAGVGRIEMAFRVGLNNAPCLTGVSYTSGSDIELFNASLDNSPGNLVNTSALRSDSDSDGIVNGIEGYPRFLNTFLDPDGVEGIDDDGDGLIDEDPADGVNNDADAFMDEDPTGSPIVPFARYFGVYGASSFIQVLVFEEVPNSSYRVVILAGDPTLGPSFLPGEIFCGPFEIRTTVDSTSSANGSVPGGDPVTNTPSAGTRLFRLETVPPPDADGDGIATVYDNCPTTANADQADSDSDAIGNACEPGTGPCAATAVVDCDGDGYSNSSDNCPTTANGTQLESEKRQPLPFGLGYVRDGLGDACDNNPLSFDLGNSLRINRYSDPICVGLTDGDGDGWCAADDPNDANAAITPEGTGVGGDAASCTNGVDDDGDSLVDFADSGCPDADGDRIIDAVDICPQAADPLQLDTSSLIPGGDACQLMASGESPVTAELRSYPDRAGANSTLRGRVVEPAPRILHNLSTGFIETTDADWTIVPGSAVPDGAIRESVTAVLDASIFPSPTCNTPLPFNFTLLDASTDYSQVIEPGANFAGLVGDSDADGLPNGVELMPVFLKSAAVLDDDGDGAVDEDPANGLDDDGDGRIDEDRPVIARLFGSIGAPHATMVLNVMIYAPVQRDSDGDGLINEDPPGDADGNGSIDDDGDGFVDEDSPEGYTAYFILGDPNAPAIFGSVSAFCTPLEVRRMRLGVTADNPRTATNEGGMASLVNAPTGGTQLFFTDLVTYPDADDDGIENTLDICVFDPDNDNDGTNDDVDPTPWNPRLVSPPGDPDGDGIPEACEVSGGAGGLGGGQSIVTPLAVGCATTVDCDGDGIENQEDNCPFVPNGYINGVQPDADRDGIGDACDTSTDFGDGGQQWFTSDGTPQCTTSASVTDEDRDGYCSGVDPDDSNVNTAGGFPEIGAFEPARCSNDIDDDGDWPGPAGSGIDADGFGTAPPDAGCADLDNDGVPDWLDNCPKTANPDQLDTDGDAGPNIGQQPFLRSDTGAVLGSPSTLLGQPFLRSSDKWGGDACDPDIDGDLLPNSNEPGGSCPPEVGGTPATRRDCDGDGLTDLFEYIFSPACQNNPNFTCPSSTCLNMFDKDIDDDGISDARENSDPASGNDGLFNYGEQVLYLAVMNTDPIYSGPSPCVNDAALLVNTDSGTLDTQRDGVERYVGTNPSVRCAADTTRNNEPVDAHPVDVDDNRTFNVIDAGAFVAPLNRPGPGNGFIQRLDLRGDLVVNTIDVAQLVPLLNKVCS